jgi:lysozyme family protein
MRATSETGACSRAMTPIQLYDTLRTMADFKQALNLVLKHEGGFINHKNDPGGATNYGISLRYLQSQKVIDGDLDNDNDVDKEDVKILTKEQAAHLYRKDFWDRNNIQPINSQRVADMFFGLCVNMGSKRATSLLRIALLNILKTEKAYEELGENLAQKINMLTEKDVITAYKEEAKSHYRYLVAKNKDLKVFLNGWLNRIDSY